jgi:3-dehydroquinate dehydratase-2
MNKTTARILLLHGPNLNRLGRRDPTHYGQLTLAQLVKQVEDWGAASGATIVAFQSNHEGGLIDWLQAESDRSDGALVNFGALTHTSYALHDALLDYGKPVVEVHLSKLSQRETWRRVSLIRAACIGQIEGRGVEGYRLALEMLLEALPGTPRS